MSEETVRAEIQARYVEAMGPDLGEVFSALYHRVAWIHMRWTMYRQLFAQSDRRVELLNDTAGTFFGALQGILFDDVILALARLTDPSQSGKDRPNLTLRRVPGLVEDLALRDEIAGLAAVALEACELIRDRRNRQLAHDDLNVALALSSDPPRGISRADIEATLLAVRELLNRLEMYYCESTTGYEFGISGPGDGDALVYYLSRGLKAEREKERRIREGTFTPEDLEHGEEV